MAKGDRVYIADKPTLDSVLERVDNIGQQKGVNLSSSMALPYKFKTGAALTLNSEIHLLGGSNTQFHYKYDGRSWSLVSMLPYLFNDYPAVVYRGEIHIFGNSHMKWNGNSWVNVSNTPYNTEGGYAVVLNDEIHLLGGNASQSDHIAHYKFDGSSWIKQANLPTNFYHGAAIVLNDEIYIIVADNMYKLEDNTWRSLPTLPASISQGTAVVYDGEIHVFLGTSSTSYSHIVFRNNSWIAASVLPSPPVLGNAVVSNNEIHLLLGNETNEHYIYRDKSWINSDEYGCKYYLLKGTKIICDNTKTIISEKVTSTEYGYIVTTTGVINIYYADEDGKCFNIV